MTFAERYRIHGDPVRAARERKQFSRLLRKAAATLSNLYIPVLMSGGYKDFTLGVCPRINEIPNELKEIADHIALLDGLATATKRGRPRSKLNYEIFRLVERNVKKLGRPNHRAVADSINAKHGVVFTSDDVKKAVIAVEKDLQRIFQGRRGW